MGEKRGAGQSAEYYHRGWIPMRGSGHLSLYPTSDRTRRWATGHRTKSILERGGALAPASEAVV